MYSETFQDAIGAVAAMPKFEEGMLVRTTIRGFDFGIGRIVGEVKDDLADVLSFKDGKINMTHASCMTRIYYERQSMKKVLRVLTEAIVK